MSALQRRFSPGAPVGLVLMVALGACELSYAPAVRCGDRPPEMGSWDLDAQYPSEVAWNAARSSLEDGLAQIERWRNRPIRDSEELADLMDAAAAVRGQAGHMARFALLKMSLDARSEAGQARYSSAAALEARVDGATAWVDPAVRRLGQQQVEAWAAADARLRVHSWRIATIFRQSLHADPVDSEPLLAALERNKELPFDLYRAILSSDLPWPTVATPAGSRTVDFLDYADLRRDPDRATRDAVNSAYFQRLRTLEQPLGLLLLRRFELECELARARGFENGIDAFFWVDDGIPTGSYRRIFQTARANAAVAVRYLKLMARLNHIARPGLGDLYAPPPGTASFQAGAVIDSIVAAWAPMGAHYQALVSERLHQPWMDLTSNPNKDGSAGGVYWAVGGGHPYIFLNFHGDLASAESLSAAAALTMFYTDLPANKRPERREEDFPVYSNAVWFAGELLYDDYLLSQANSRERRMAILSSQLYRLWNAYFQFAITTELADNIAQAVASHRAMSGSDISRTYLALLHVYYEDPDIDIDSLFAGQWMSYPFIFGARHILPEWAMAVAAGADLEARIQARTAEAMTTVGAPLAEPSSFTSHDLLRDAGINIETDAPYEALIRKMTSDMNRLERELMH